VSRSLGEASGNQIVARTFCDEAFRTQQTDHSRALIALALLGEMRSDEGVSCLQHFVEQPLPEKGTVTEGEILERSRLETLQAKAIQGIAYRRSDATDRFVLDSVTNHPSRFVRTQAIAAYLFNHDYSEQARKTAYNAARPEERIFVDRVVRRGGETKEDFNPKVRAFLETHPDAIAPNPEPRNVRPDLNFLPPPDFNGRQQ
jgi:hypothetical protein